MKQSTKLLASLFLVTLLLLPLVSAFAMAIDAQEPVCYVITNPYNDVDFGSWNAYKTQLHVHTNASDGAQTIQTVVEEHYRLGFDILAVTDHAVLNRGWDNQPNLVPIHRLVKYSRTKMAPIVPVTAERYTEITNGTDRLDSEGNPKPMLDVPMGIENTISSPTNSHINGYFVEYGQGLLGVHKDYETPAKAIAELGGLSMINHPGDTTGSYADPSVNNKTSVISKYASLFLKYYPSCFALDINSISDGTRTDEVLYDNVLAKLIPYGITPWLVSFSDAHDYGQWNRGFTVHMMHESLEASNKVNALADLKRSMQEGTYFGVYTYAPGGEVLPEDSVYPMVKDIIVEGNTITIIPEDADMVTEVVWVTNGTRNINEGNYTIDVADFADEIGSFVRVYLRGPGGICYVQPFTVIPEGVTLEKESIVAPFDISVVLRKLVTFLDELFFQDSVLVALFKKYALGIGL